MSNFIVRKVAVLGAGVMGAQIAAHLVNARVDVLLYDLPAKDGGGEPWGHYRITSISTHAEDEGNTALEIGLDVGGEHHERFPTHLTLTVLYTCTASGACASCSVVKGVDLFAYHP